MVLERKQFINLTFGLDAYESWADLNRGATNKDWGYYLLEAPELVSAQTRGSISLDQMNARIVAVEAQRKRDRQVLSEAETIKIVTAQIDPNLFAHVGIYDGIAERLYPREFGALVAAAGRSQDQTLRFINRLVANIKKTENKWSLEPIWGREGNMQMYADFLRKPVVSFVTANLKQQYLPRR